MIKENLRIGKDVFGQKGTEDIAHHIGLRSRHDPAWPLWLYITPDDV